MKVWRLRLPRATCGASLAAAIVLAACSTLPAPPEPARQALQAAGLPDDSLAFVAFPLDARGQGWRLRAEQPMAPASTLKLLTAAVALEQLGANARATTELRAERPPQAGVLAGPLFVRGGGEADLEHAELHALLRSLREQGVEELRGGVVLDRSLFQPEREDLGQPPFDESPEADYNVIPDALQLGGSVQTLHLSASPAGALQARLSPELGRVDWDFSTLQVAPGDCPHWDDGWQTPAVEAPSLRIQLRGRFPSGCSIDEPLQLLDRDLVWTLALRRYWQELGGRWGPGADIRWGTTPPGTLLLAFHRERPLAELLRGLMKRSDNAQARLLYLRLGAQAAQPGELTRSAADRVVRAWLRGRGLDPAGLVLDNGSGLSRQERIRPALMAALLAQLADDARLWPEFLATLPVAGVDGTLSRRLKGGPAIGRARLKTGTLRDAVGLAGYVWDARDRPWVFVAYVNHPEAAQKGRPVLDALAEYVAAQR